MAVALGAYRRFVRLDLKALIKQAFRLSKDGF